MIAEDRRRFDSLVERLTLEEKAHLLTGKTAWRTWALPQIGLREMVFSDGPIGVRGTGESGDETSDCLPSPTALAACWSEELAHRVGRWFADQARRHGVDVVLAPVVNLQRVPVGGRHFECLSEDPLLTGQIGAAWIDGTQECGVASC
ncbi:MAG: glycosyl hydrolase, partial [Propionibacteriaceae bacterium]|nr:glycosyl hydrolase [Propionibacteriaceae bacterium]